jgi:hypothetical protein
LASEQEKVKEGAKKIERTPSLPPRRPSEKEKETSTFENKGEDTIKKHKDLELKFQKKLEAMSKETAA